MIYELLNTDDHPLVVVTTVEERPHPADCPCGQGGVTKELRVHVEGSASTGTNVAALLTAVVELVSHDQTTREDRRQVRRMMARILEAIS